MKKNKDFLVCIDSDGCVLDTMDIKHDKCLAPCMLKIWDLGKYRIELITRWREINIYSLDRGTNRFKGLAKMLKEVNENYKRVEGLAGYIHWVNTTDELSEESLRDAYEETGNECIRKALAWSELVNGSMDFMHDGEAVAFEGVKEALEEIDQVADIAVVSAANKAEVEKEWRQNGILSYVDEIHTQEEGEKDVLIQTLLADGNYDKDHVLMIGDSPSDLEAAGKNGVLFYPILAREEEVSWEKFREALAQFVKLEYRGGFQRKLNKEFLDNL